MRGYAWSVSGGGLTLGLTRSIRIFFRHLTYESPTPPARDVHARQASEDRQSHPRASHSRVLGDHPCSAPGSGPVARVDAGRAPRQCASGSAVLQACSRPPSGSDGSPGFDAARRLIGIVLSNQGNTAGGKPGGGGSFALSSSLLSTLEAVGVMDPRRRSTRPSGSKHRGSLRAHAARGGARGRAAVTTCVPVALRAFVDWHRQQSARRADAKDPRRKRRGFRRKVSVMLGESVPQTP